MNSSVAELANTSAKERGCLDQCRDLLSTLAAMQVRRVQGFLLLLLIYLLALGLVKKSISSLFFLLNMLTISFTA